MEIIAPSSSKSCNLCMSQNLADENQRRETTSRPQWPEISSNPLIGGPSGKDFQVTNGRRADWVRGNHTCKIEDRKHSSERLVQDAIESSLVAEYHMGQEHCRKVQGWFVSVCSPFLTESDDRRRQRSAGSALHYTRQSRLSEKWSVHESAAASSSCQARYS